MQTTRNKPVLIRGNIVNPDGTPTGEQRTFNMEDLLDANGKIAPKPRHESLPDYLRRRADALYEVGRDCFRAGGKSLTRQQWLDGFLYDQNPDQEISKWGRIGATVDKLWQDDATVKLTREMLTRSVNMAISGFVDVPAHCNGVTDALVEKIRDTFDDAWAETVNGEEYLDVRSIKHPEVREAMKAADVIIGRDISLSEPTVSLRHNNNGTADIEFGQEHVFWGVAALRKIKNSGETRDVSIVRFNYDGTCDELEYLVAAVEAIRGACCYPGGEQH